MFQENIESTKAKIEQMINERKEKIKEVTEISEMSKVSVQTNMFLTGNSFFLCVNIFFKNRYKQKKIWKTLRNFLPL